MEGRRPVELLEPRRPEAFDEEERRRSWALVECSADLDTAERLRSEDEFMRSLLSARGCATTTS